MPAELPRARSTTGAIGSIGFIVQDVLAGSPAERAGLQKNDIIRVGGNQFHSMREFSNFGQQEAGSLVQFMVVRHENGHKNSYTMEVATVPAPQSLEQ